MRILSPFLRRSPLAGPVPSPLSSLNQAGNASVMSE